MSDDAPRNGTGAPREAGGRRASPPSYDADKSGYAGISAGVLDDPDDVRAARAFAEMIVDTVREGLLVLDLDLCVKAANESFYQTFEVEPEETVGRRVYDLGNGQWDIPELHKLLERILPEDHAFDDFEVEHDFENVGRRVVLLNARQLDDHQLILLAIEDVTAQRTGEREQQQERERRQQAEEALTASEAAFRHLADAVPHLVWTALPDGSVEYYSRQAERYAGLRQQDDGTWEWAPVLHPGDTRRTAEAWSCAVESEAPYEVEHRLRMADGSYRWHVSRALPARDANDRVERWYGTATDIHRVKETEAALRKNEDRLRRTQKAARLGTWDLDVATGEVSWSEGVFDLFGLPPEEGVPSAEAWSRLLHPDDRERVDQAVAAAIEAGGHYENEFRIVRPDGEVLWVAAQGHVLRDAESHQARFLGVNYDITSRKQTEEALVDERAKLEAIIDTLPVGLVIADPEGRIVRDNAAARELWGMPLRAESWEDYGGFVGWWPETGERIKTEEWAMSRALSQGEVTHGELVQNQEFSSDVRHYYLNNVAPIRDADGRIIGAVAAMLDVTQRVQMEAALKDLNETLEARVEERTQQVRELARALALAEQDERQRIAYVLHENLQQIIFGAKLASSFGDAERLDDILDEALALTRSLSHELSPPLLKEEDLEHLLQWIAEKKHERYGMEIEVEVSSDVRVPDPALRVLLYQLLRELIFNVVKHAGTTRARLTAEQADGQVRVSVEDEGDGFDPAELNASGSTGLGLPSVRERLELVGGHLDLASAPGEGTRVTITVPVPTD